ncbi:hypothetical protein L7F22_032575 [Adiantum nelumboides]|nr:hypothetical protein [Adiantum nelumboides]
MWSPGTFQSGNQVEVVQPVSSQRKRSIDLVRQAQFAACSYLGFDPYEEKHNNGVVHQVPTSDGSVPVELHLHHHHHHHCRENDDVLKRPSHMSASADSPLGVGSLLSLCDHIQMFQDAWQGHSGRADERSQKFMLHGALMKRDSSFAGLEAGSPGSIDKKETIRERSFPMCADRYWNGGIAAAPAISQTLSDNHHFNTAARISHWECSVVQEEKLTKGFGVRIGQAERSRPLDTSEFLAEPADFGWMADSKHTSLATIPNTTKAERTYMPHSREASISSVNTQESLSGSSRKFGSVVTKRKKSFSDMDVGHDQRSLSSFDTASGSCIDTKTVSQSRQAQPAYISAKKVPGLQLPARGFAAEESCDSQGCETDRTMISLCSGKGGGLPLKTGLSLNCDECTCQQSLPTPRSSSSIHQNKQETTSIQMSVQGLMKDFKVGLESSNVSSKQHCDLSEKIISLDECEDGDVCSPHFKSVLERSVVKKPNRVSSIKDFSCFPVPFTKVPEDCNGRRDGDDTGGKRGQHLSVERGAENILSRNAGSIAPKNDEILGQNAFTADKDHATQDFNALNNHTRASQMPSMGYQPHNSSMLRKDLGKASYDGGFQMELCDQGTLEEKTFPRQQVQCKADLPFKSAPKSLGAESRRKIQTSKLCSPDNVGLISKKADSVAMGKSDVPQVKTFKSLIFV